MLLNLKNIQINGKKTVSIVDDKEDDVNEWRACHIPVVEVEDRVIKYQFSSKKSVVFSGIGGIVVSIAAFQKIYNFNVSSVEVPVLVI